MRVVHGLETQYPAKPTATKKRKREDSDAEEEPFVAPDSNGEDDDAGEADEDDVYNPKGRKSRARKSKAAAAGAGAGASTAHVKSEGTLGVLAPEPEPEISDTESSEGYLEDMDPHTGLIHGCRPAKAKYMISKAKYRYAIGEHERLLASLKFQQEEIKCLRIAKDDTLNDLLKAQYG